MDFNKKAIIVHSGGMDSSLCLALALKEFGKNDILSLSFSYRQRHSIELERAALICNQWGVDHVTLDIGCLNQITENSLTRHHLHIVHKDGESPNSLVVGRNGLMGRIAAIHADSLGARYIYMGVIEVESANSGYRDCSRKYMDLLESILRIDLDNPGFEIRTPLVKMTKAETMALGQDLGVLEFLLENTISCYNGVEKIGCQECPACKLRNEGLVEFLKDHRDLDFSYRDALGNR